MGSNMPQRLDHKLDCKACGTIYLEIPEDVQSHTPIYCSSCGALLGRWDELERDFNQQGGSTAFSKCAMVKSYEGNDPMRIDFDDDPEDGSSGRGFYIPATVFIAGLLLAAGIGWYF